jgi:predicted AlkP superfamily phosphohydrolase/phosphomutase
MNSSNHPGFLKSLIRQGIISWVQASLLIAVIYTLQLGYTSLIIYLKDYIMLFIYIAIIGILIGIIFGALCGLAIGLFYKIFGIRVLPSKVSSLCYSILFVLISIVLLYRKYAFNISYSQYPFIKSYKLMLLFISLRMIAFIIGSIIAAYLLYRFVLYVKNAFFNTRRRIIIARISYSLLLLIVLCGFAGLFTSKTKEMSKLRPFHRAQFNIDTERQVFLIGTDGASWDVINHLISDDTLPNIKKLMQCGSYAPLRTLKPCLSPMVWTSIDTGKVPQKHGILNFYRFSIPGIVTMINPYETIGADNAGRMLNRLSFPLELVYYHYGLRRAKPVWQIISQQGVDVGVINGYYSWPSPEVNGFIVSDRFPYFVLQEPCSADEIREALTINKQEPRLALAYPGEEIYQHIASYLRENAPLEPSKRLQRMKEMAVADYLDFSSFPFFYYLIEHYEPNFLDFYFTEPDISQHLYWHYWEPQFFPTLSESELEENKDIIPSVYREVDQAISRLQEIAGEDAVIMVVSDHGFGAYFNGPTPGGHAHSPDGIFIISGKGIKQNASLKNPSILDITPTILYMYNLPIARDMDGRVLTELFEPQYLEAHPISYIESYGAPGKTFKGFKEEMSEDQLKKLKALGYIQ